MFVPFRLDPRWIPYLEVEATSSKDLGELKLPVKEAFARRNFGQDRPPAKPLVDGDFLHLYATRKRTVKVVLGRQLAKVQVRAE